MAEYFVPLRQKKTYKSRKTAIQSEYKKMYRFDFEHVDWLTNYFLGESSERKGGAIPNRENMCIFLRFCADPGFQNGIGEDVGVHQTTVSRVIGEMAQIISGRAHEWIKFPSTDEEIRAAQNQWEAKNRFPFAIGVIDCTHIRIKKPSSQSDEYIYRKGFHSINVQATCDGNEWFTSLDVSWPDSVHDSRVLRNSSIYTIIGNAQSNALLLGDEGYALSPWLMTPFRNPQAEAKLNYNRIFKKERCIIERCFGQVKQRFALLQYKVRVATELVPMVIASCFVLHNIAKFLKDDFIFDESYSYTPNDSPHSERDESVRTNSRVLEAGKRKRQLISNLLN